MFVKLTAALALIILNLSCVKHNIENNIIPKDIFVADVINKNCIYKQEYNFEAAIEAIDDKEWEELLEYDLFVNKSKSCKHRLPPVLFFKIIFHNTGSGSLKIRNMNIKYNTITAGSLNDNIRKKFKSPVYSIFNFKNIFSFWKIEEMYEDLCSFDFDYSRLTKITDESVNSRETVFKILAFDSPPANIRQFTINIAIEAGNEEKIVAFDFKRFEYRTKGNAFVLPDDETYDLEDPYGY